MNLSRLYPTDFLDWLHDKANIPYYMITPIEESVPFSLLPLVNLVMGALHLFRPCCVVEFALRRFGELWKLPLPPWPETQYYDDDRRCQQCLFCSRKISRTVGLGDDWFGLETAETTPF